MSSPPLPSFFASFIEDLPNTVKFYVDFLNDIKFTATDTAVDAITGSYFIFTGLYFTFYGHRSFQDFMTWAALMLGFWLTPIFYQYVIGKFILPPSTKLSISSFLDLEFVKFYKEYFSIDTEMVIESSIRIFLFFIAFAGWYGSRLQGKKNPRRNKTSCSVAFGAIASRLLCMISDKSRYNNYLDDHLTNYCLSMMGGIVFETAVLFTWRPMVILAFGIFGYVSGMYIEAMLELFANSSLYSIIFRFCFALLFCILSHILKSASETIISGLLGSYVTVFGANYFINNGLFHTFISDNFIKIFLGQKHDGGENLIRISCVMLVIILALGILGMILQIMEIIDTKSKKEIERLESDEFKYTQKSTKKKGPILTVKRKTPSPISNSSVIPLGIVSTMEDEENEEEDLEDPNGKDRVQFYE